MCPQAPGEFEGKDPECRVAFSLGTNPAAGVRCSRQSAAGFSRARARVAAERTRADDPSLVSPPLWPRHELCDAPPP